MAGWSRILVGNDMNYAQWRAESERLLNQMEHAPYKSAAYFEWKSKLENHFRIKPPEEGETTELGWVMSGAAPLSEEPESVFYMDTGHAGDAVKPDAADFQKAGTILHHIMPEQVLELEAMFGKKTKSGLQLPPWLLGLRAAAMVPPKVKDFEPTRPSQMT
jgi:hypothetical protein